jgi:NitT/TauT family transport system substrate-binding protein
MKKNLPLFIIILLFTNISFSADKKTLRVGILAFGTVNWELTTLKSLDYLKNADFEIKIQAVANPQAGKIALQSGAVDVIVSDWVWVSRMRSTGSDFTFYPYSTTAGALMVPKNSSIKSVKDLAGKKLGVAGGELDKNWLLLQALSQQNYQVDLNKSVEKVYGAPPLLNQQILANRVDALINYWHFAARLEAKGYQQLLNGQEILQQLGIKEKVPTLGYVFGHSWGTKNKAMINAFLKATQQAKDQLCKSDKAWQDIVPLTKAKDTTTQNKLRQRYCEGRVKQWGANEQKSAAKIYAILHKLSKNKLTGKSEKLQENTFWSID